MKVMEVITSGRMPEVQESAVQVEAGATRNEYGGAAQSGARKRVAVALLTGGCDKHYALGLTSALAARKVFVDFIGSDEVNGPELHGSAHVRFLNLRGSQRRDATRIAKVLRVLKYYARLVRYAWSASPGVFHILWNNKFEWLDRTLVMLYYRGLGKRIAFTAHNVNKQKRDGHDTAANRLGLRIPYYLSNHIFVHTERMKEELAKEFGVPGAKVSVIPYGINNKVPNTNLTGSQARRTLGLDINQKVMLFFGNIAPYKGLDILITAFGEIVCRSPEYRLIVAGRPKNCDQHWRDILEAIARSGLEDRVIQKIGYVPDEETEIYFKAADVLVLPYRSIFQSGVLSLGFSFGLPVVATDVGSFKEGIIEGETGFVCRPQDPRDLAAAIEKYFSSNLFRHLQERRLEIRRNAEKQNSWSRVGEITGKVYEQLLTA